MDYLDQIVALSGKPSLSVFDRFAMKKILMFTLLVIGVTALPNGVIAQTPGLTPLQVEPDPSGLDLLGGKIALDGPVLSIPAAPRLTYKRGPDWYLSLTGNDKPNGGSGNETASYTIDYGGARSVAFTCEFSVCRDVREGYVNKGSSLWTINLHFYNFDDQALYKFEVPSYDVTYMGENGIERALDYRASEIVYPDGETISISYQSESLGPNSNVHRPLAGLE